MNIRMVKIELVDEELKLNLSYRIGSIPDQREFLRQCTVQGLDKPAVPKVLSIIFANRVQIESFETNLQLHDLSGAIKILAELAANADHRLLMTYLNKINYAEQLHEANTANHFLAPCLGVFGCGSGYPKPRFSIEETYPVSENLSYSL